MPIKGKIKGKQIADGTIDQSKLSFDLNYVHEQVMPSAIWTINHGLGRYTTVTIYDTNDNIIEAEVQKLNNNTIRILFNTTEIGKAFIN